MIKKQELQFKQFARATESALGLLQLYAAALGRMVPAGGSNKDKLAR